MNGALLPNNVLLERNSVMLPMGIPPYGCHLRILERIRAAGPSQGANYSPSGGSAAAEPQAWGPFRAAGPSQGANYSPSGGSAAAEPQAWGPFRAAGPSQGANYSPSGGSAAAEPQAWGPFRAAGPS